MNFLQHLLEDNQKNDFITLAHAHIKSTKHAIEHGIHDPTLKNHINTIETHIKNKYKNIPAHKLNNTMQELTNTHDILTDHFKSAKNSEKNSYGKVINLINHIKTQLFIKQPPEPVSTTYHGEHSAPTKEGNAPLHDLTHNGIYPTDVYSNPHQYKTNDTDFESINTISYAKGKPNRTVTVYRAIPNDLTAKDRIGNIEKKMQKMISSHKLPKDAHPTDTWDNHYSKLKTMRDNELANMNPNEKQPKINSGDWVSISKRYAIEHGKDNLNGNFKIISKTVPAKHLFTDGNSLSEWGYDSSDK